MNNTTPSTIPSAATDVSDPVNAKVSNDQVQQVLELFNNLRSIDEHIYLSSGSINTINGMVGLNFSVDATQYMLVEDFLNKNWYKWIESQKFKDNIENKEEIFTQNNFDQSFLSPNKEHSIELR